MCIEVCLRFLFLRCSIVDALYSCLNYLLQQHAIEHRFKDEVCCEQNSGQMVPLDELCRLKEEYKFRVLIDESNSIGVLGKTGRGISEHFNISV